MTLFAGAALFALAGCGASVPQPPPLERAQSALRAGDGFGAELILRAMVESGTPEAEVRVHLGEAAMLQGKIAAARALLATPGDSRSQLLLGRLEMREGNHAAAGQAFDRALAQTPNDPSLWVEIARLRYAGGEQVQAVEAAKRAVRHGPGDSQALLLRGQLVRDAHGKQVALPWFEAALRHAPGDVEVLAEYAATLGELGRVKDMLVVVRRLAERGGGNARAAYLQAVLAARAGNDPLARSLLSRSGAVERGMPAAMLLSGVVDLRQENYASAAQIFDQLTKLQPENRRVQLLLAQSLALGGNNRELTHRFSALAARPGASPYLRMVVGRAWEALGEREKAAAFLDAAAQSQGGALVALPPTLQSEDVLHRVRGAVDAGDAAQALALAEKFRVAHPGSADAMQLSGDALFARGEPARAFERYAFAAQVRRSWPLVRRMVGALQATGDTAGGARLLRAHLAGNPHDAEAAGLLARLAFAAGDAPRTAQLLDHAMMLGVNRDPELQALRAQAALRLGDTATAEAAARRAFALQRSSPAAVQTLAMVFAATGDQALARALLARQSADRRLARR